MTTVTSSNSTAAAASTTAASTSKTDSMAEASDRFLKLLVTQMQNQDPLNPMDNAQVTSQMAQINTVTGIEKLNTTMGNMSSSFSQMQMLQGVSLVGHQVQVEGNKLFVDSTGAASGGFTLDGTAASVAVDIVDSAGAVVDTVSLGSKSGGEHGFTWTPPTGTSADGMSFKVRASNSGTAVGSTSLMTDTVDAVRTGNDGLNLQLRNAGNTAYTKVKALA